MIKTLKNSYLSFLLVVPLFFCIYHYNGIVVDAILYVTQYVYSIDPARFGGDPAFEFGNQGSLGLFSPFFGVFLELFGVASGAFVFTLLMQLAWILAAIFMIKALLRLTWQRLWVLPVTILFVICFANGMGFSHIHFFQYVALYACSRVFSIVLGISALALIFYQKKCLSLLLILFGTAVHPITAGWCLPFWMFFFFPKTRVPVLVFSILFPLTFLLHYSVFDVYPEDWLQRPLEYTPDYEILCRFIVLFVFFGLLSKCVLNVWIRKISVSMFFLMIITFYWSLCGGFGEHIFLYQVQPWRSVWIPSLVAVPLGACFVKNIALKLKRNKVVSTHDLAVLLLFVSFFMPANIILVSIGALLLGLQKEKKVSMKGMVWLFGTFLMAGLLAQQYLTMCVQGLFPLVGFVYKDAYLFRDSFLIYQMVFVVGFAVFFFKQRKIMLAAFLIATQFFSRFMILPILPVFLFFFPRGKKMMFWGGFLLIVVLTLFDGMFDVDLRRRTVLECFPSRFLWICFASSISLIPIFLYKRFSNIVVVASIVFLCGAAIANYNVNSANWSEGEKQLDYYLHNPLFPQVKEKGRTLFFVSGPFADEPRLRFLTGSYFSHSVMVGDVFSKDHYRTALERSHLLYRKKRESQSTIFYDYGEIRNKFAVIDTLVDRFTFLCDEKEVTHLVTDKRDLPFVIEDSTIATNSQKIYLYGCD